MLINFNVEKESSKGSDQKISYIQQHSLRSEQPRIDFFLQRQQ